MISRGLADGSLAPEETVLVGDKASNIEAARRGGVKGLGSGAAICWCFRAKSWARGSRPSANRDFPGLARGSRRAKRT